MHTSRLNGAWLLLFSHCIEPAMAEPFSLFDCPNPPESDRSQMLERAYLLGFLRLSLPIRGADALDHAQLPEISVAWEIKSLFRFLAWVAREIRLQARDLHSTPRQPISVSLHRHVSSCSYIRCQYRTSAALSRFMTSSDSYGPRFCCLIGSACRYQRNGPEESTRTALERATLLFGSLLHKVSLTEALKVSFRPQLIVRQSMTIRSIFRGDSRPPPP